MARGAPLIKGPSGRSEANWTSCLWCFNKYVRSASSGDEFAAWAHVCNVEKTPVPVHWCHCMLPSKKASMFCPRLYRLARKPTFCVYVIRDPSLPWHIITSGSSLKFVQNSYERHPFCWQRYLFSAVLWFTSA